MWKFNLDSIKKFLKRSVFVGVLCLVFIELFLLFFTKYAFLPTFIVFILSLFGATVYLSLDCLYSLYKWSFDKK